MSKQVLTRSERRALREAVEWMTSSDLYPVPTVFVVDTCGDLHDEAAEMVTMNNLYAVGAEEAGKIRIAIAAQLGCERLGW